MAGFFTDVKDVVIGAFKKWQEHKATRMAAALAYFGILSLAPLAVLMVAIAGSVYGRRAAEGLLVDQLSSSIGTDAAHLLESMIANMYERGGGVLASIIAVAVVLFGASGLIGNLRDSLNTVWEVEPRSKKGIHWTILTKLIDIGVAVAAGVFFLGTMLANTALSAIIKLFADSLPLPAWLIQVAGILLTLILITLFLIFIFRVLPNADLSVADVWLGALISAVLFTIGNFAIGIYLGRAGPGSVFGAAGSVVVLMIWIYYSALIILFGAELTRVIATRRHRLVRPARQQEAIRQEHLPAHPA